MEVSSMIKVLQLGAVKQKGAVVPGAFSGTIAGFFFTGTNGAQAIVPIAWEESIKKYYKAPGFDLIICPLVGEWYDLTARMPAVAKRSVDEHIRTITLLRLDQNGNRVTEPQGALVEGGIVPLGRIRAPKNGEQLVLEYQHLTPEILANAYIEAYPGEALEEILNWGELSSPQIS
jgi:hypothetical protein